MVKFNFFLEKYKGYLFTWILVGSDWTFICRLWLIKIHNLLQWRYVYDYKIEFEIVSYFGRLEVKPTNEELQLRLVFNFPQPVFILYCLLKQFVKINLLSHCFFPVLTLDFTTVRLEFSKMCIISLWCWFGQTFLLGLADRQRLADDLRWKIIQYCEIVYQLSKYKALKEKCTI